MGTIVLKLALLDRVVALREIREASKGKEPVVVDIPLFAAMSYVGGHERRVVRAEKLTYHNGELTLYSYYDSEIWASMNPEERRIAEGTDPRQQHGPRNHKPRPESRGPESRGTEPRGTP